MEAAQPEDVTACPGSTTIDDTIDDVARHGRQSPQTSTLSLLIVFMDVAVHPGARLALPLPSPNALDSVGDASNSLFEATMALYCDNEEPQADRHRLRRDDSLGSSSVTTPIGAISRPPPPPRLGSRHMHKSSSGSTPPVPPPPGHYLTNHLIGLPPPPPSTRAPTAYQESSRPSTELIYPLPRPPSPHSSARAFESRRQANHPPLPPPPRPDHDTFQGSSTPFRGRPPPPPPPPRSSSSSNSRSGDEELSQFQAWESNLLKAPRHVELSKPPSIPTSEERSYHSRDRQSRRNAPGRHAVTFRGRYPSASGSSTYSNTRPTDSRSSVSDSSSEEDPFLYRNARKFPPLLPAAPAFRSPAQDSRTSATNRITNWVSQHERTQSPRMVPPAGRLPIPTSGSSDVAMSEASDASSEGEIELLWTQLKEKRARLNEIKTQMAKKRKELRELRREKDDADNAFMGVIRPILVSQRGVSHLPPNHLLDRRLGEMQRIRTEYHFLESTYEGLEVVLDEEEEVLNNLETRFFSLLAAGRTRVIPPPIPEGEREPDPIDMFKDMPLCLKGISPEGPPEDLHPLYMELISTVGDLENAKEEYEDLIFVKEEYIHDQEVGNASSKKVSDEELEFFAEFPEEERRRRESIETLNGVVKRLKLQCEEKGRDEFGARHVFSSSQSARTCFAADFPQNPLDALKSASRLPDDDAEKRSKIQLTSKEYAIDRLLLDHETGGKADFMNRWLLQQLRTSPLNAILLHSTFISSRALKIRDFWRWQSDVLHYWWRDSTMTLEDGFLDRETNDSSDYTSRVGTSKMSRAHTSTNGRALAPVWERDEPPPFPTSPQEPHQVPVPIDYLSPTINGREQPQPLRSPVAGLR
ncbi:hypothetical protein G7046_g4304 [Stylonectria norvegica]|nr:hypothetical protein G7046_g4304 [Stylonectria norvegica]